MRKTQYSHFRSHSIYIVDNYKQKSNCTRINQFLIDLLHFDNRVLETDFDTSEPEAEPEAKFPAFNK